MAVFLVEIPDLNGMTKKNAEDYVRVAVRSWAGGCHPDHPFFGHLSQPGQLKVKVLTAQEERLWKEEQRLEDLAKSMAHRRPGE